MLVKTEVYEDDGDVRFGEGGLEQMELDVKPELKREQPEEFIPSRVRPRLDIGRRDVEDGGEDGVVLRCPKCSITYRSRASMKNHTSVCKGGKDQNAVDPLSDSDNDAAFPQTSKTVVVDDEMRNTIRILEQSCFRLEGEDDKQRVPNRRRPSKAKGRTKTNFTPRGNFGLECDCSSNFSCG